MTYANDCIAMQHAAKRKTLKRISAHSAEELDAAIELAARKFGEEDFYLMLHGIDAYMERRRRREDKKMLNLRLFTSEDFDGIWGKG